MLTLKLILVLAVLGWSLYSAVVYWSRRGDNKQALQTLQSDAAPQRSLTMEESVALAPFLFEPAKPAKPMPLRREGVFALHGAYVRHGLSTSQGGETMHDTIGGVEVILPYDARDFLEPHNRAEVVFTEKFALVVGLNGTFDLLGGRARALRRQQQDQQWQTGKPGEVTEVAPLDAAAGDESALRDALRVEMMGQRDETPAELADRAGPGLGWLASLAWAFAFASLGIASAVDAAQRPYWAVPAAALASLALWWTWGRRAPAAPGKVNRVRGHVTAIAPALPGGGLGPVRWFVGDKFPVELPGHWKARWAVPPEGPVEVEMRVADHTAVRFGKALSVDDEVTRFAPVRWGRHLVLALTGALAMAVLPWWADGLRNDLVLTSAWLRHTPPVTADSPQALAARLPEVGTPVHLSGQAGCDWVAREGERPRMDCTRLRWGAPAQAAAPILVDDLTRSLHGGEFLNARGNAGLDLMLQMQMMGSAEDPLARYQAMANAPKVVTGLARLVQTVDAACSPSSDACDRLRTTLADGLLVDGEDAPKDWAAWTQLAAGGQLTGDRDMAVMRGSTVSSVLSAGREVAEHRATALIAVAQAARAAAAPGTVVLVVEAGPDTRLPAAPEEADVLAFIDELNGAQSDQSRQSFDVDGLLVGRDSGPGGVPVLAVDAARRLGDPWPSLMRAGWLALGALLLLVHGGLFAVRLAQARQRSRQVAAFIDQRLPPAGFGA